MLRPLNAGLAFVVFLALPSLLLSRDEGNRIDWDWNRQFSLLHAVDGLGRVLPTSVECGPLREGKFVGVFYFLWHGEHEPSGPWDLSKILEEDPPPFGPPGAFHHWAKPELGYYRSSDPYVFEVHAEWLTAARVDMIVIDVTNGHSYLDNLKVLCDTWLRLRSLGNPTPQISFLARTEQGRVVQELYDAFYGSEAYADLWFKWDGKPLFLADRDEVPEGLRGQFTFRESWAWTRSSWFGDGRGKWAWLDHTPQAPGLSDEGEVEQISVAVAQHATTNMGRSHFEGRQPSESEQHPELGIYFAEQWEHALEVDPDFIFITGWNEWVAQRFVKSEEHTYWNQLAGEPLQLGDSVFVDAYTLEFSRDIEPMQGGYGWNYYYQMVDGIRRFKGAAEAPRLPLVEALRIDGDLSDWTEYAEFRDFKGESVGGSHEGWVPGTVLDRDERALDIVSSTAASSDDWLFLGLQFVSLREEAVFLSLQLSPLDGADTIEFQILFASGTVKITTIPAGWRRSDVSVGVAEGALELSLRRSSMPGLETFGFAWSARTVPNALGASEAEGEEAPVADYLYPVVLSVAEGGSD